MSVVKRNNIFYWPWFKSENEFLDAWWFVLVLVENNVFFAKSVGIMAVFLMCGSQISLKSISCGWWLTIIGHDFFLLFVWSITVQDNTRRYYFSHRLIVVSVICRWIMLSTSLTLVPFSMVRLMSDSLGTSYV